MLLRSAWWCLGLAGCLGLSVCACSSDTGDAQTGAAEEECLLGAEGCDCTSGGACDPGLTCLSETCVDPGGGSGGNGASGGGTNSGGSSGSAAGGSGGTSSTGGSGGSAEGGTGGTSSTGGSGGSAVGGSGGNDATVLLRNDGFEDGQVAVFQGGFIAGECWSVTYKPAPGDYPFQVVSVDALVGQVQVPKVFRVRVYSVDANNAPDEILANGDVLLSGSGANFNQVVFADHAIDTRTIESGNFAIAFCHANHEAEPSIARDNDGMSSSDLNHIFASGMWLTSNFYGVTGDWIQRAHIRPL